jgi:hypothetical protein
VQWLRALSESDVYLRCYGDKTGTVDILGTAEKRREHPVTRLKIDPDLLPDEAQDEQQAERSVEAA